MAKKYPYTTTQLRIIALALNKLHVRFNPKEIRKIEEEMIKKSMFIQSTTSTILIGLFPLDFRYCHLQNFESKTHFIRFNKSATEIKIYKKRITKTK